MLLASLTNATLAGALFSIPDAIVLLAHRDHECLRLALATVGLDVALGVLIGLPTFAVFRRLANVARIQTITEGLRTPEGRLRALGWLFFGCLAAAMTWLVGIWLGKCFLLRFRNEAVAVAALVTVILIFEIGLALVLVVVISPVVNRWSANASALALLASRRFQISLVAIVIAAPYALLALVGRIAFAQSDMKPGYLALTTLLICAVVVSLAPATRLRLRTQVTVCVTGLGFVFAGVAMGSASPASRDEIGRSGVPSALALRGLYYLGDRDGDGVPGLFGGADCDDADPHRSPLAHEKPGNGFDENCTGADLPAQPHNERTAGNDSFHPDVLLITVDTLRADHLGSYGYQRNISPNLDAFSRRAVRFTRAESPSPSTRRALPALLYGRYASTLPFEIHDKRPTVKENDLPTLAASLAAAGYRTHVVMAVSGLMQQSWLRGFGSAETVSPDATAENAEQVTDAALAWLQDRTDAPRFLWVHYIDPHEPYSSTLYGVAPMDRYDSELHRVDNAIGRLLQAMGDAEQRTLVIVTADHGEAFNEHSWHFHGQTLFEEETHVPLLFSLPGNQPRIVDTPVSLVDIAPTVLDLLGLSADMRGRSLAKELRGSGDQDRGVLIELFRDGFGARNTFALVKGTQKLIWNVDDNRYEYFDLSADPTEHRDSAPHLRAELLERLDTDLRTDDDGTPAHLRAESGSTSFAP